MLVDKSWLFVVCWCAAMLELLIVARLKVSPVMQAAGALYLHLSL